MQIRSNSRQVPKDIKYTSDRKYSDLLYSYLQCISEYDGNCRVISKKKIKFSTIGEKIGLGRQTTSKKFKDLLAIGLVKEDGDFYVLQNLERNVAALVPYDVLQVLVDTLSDNSISVYVYLMNRFIANKEESFDIYIDQLKSYIGIATSTRGNNITIVNILNVLQKLELIKFTVRKDCCDDEYRTKYVILSVSNTIKF